MNGKDTVKLVLFALLVLSTGACAQSNGQRAGQGNDQAAIRKSEAGTVNWVASLAEGLETARESGKPVMVDFYADWCGWCKKLDREVYTVNDVIKLSKEFVNVKVNTDKNPEEARRYKVQGLPTVVFLGPNGDVLEEFVGYRAAPDFIRVMKEILNNVKPR
ncbi:MAG: thioredoxin family protein [Endomicrobiales bacterium]